MHGILLDEGRSGGLLGLGPLHLQRAETALHLCELLLFLLFPGQVSVPLDKSSTGAAVAELTHIGDLTDLI